MSDIILYNCAQLERFSGKDLVNMSLLHKDLPRFFIASSVYVGKHNQAGFVIVDRTPDRRPYWIGSDMLRFSPHEVEKEIERGTIPKEKRYFYDTTGGMAALRFFAVSDNLISILEKDEFIGHAMIRKICEQDAVPAEFDELPVHPSDCRERIGEYNPYSYGMIEENGLRAIIDQALGPLTERTGREYNPEIYVTYFPTAAYPLIVPTLESSVQKVVARFDEFGDRFGILEKNKGTLTGNPRLIN